MKYLIEVTETHRVNSEHEVDELINAAKEDGRYILKKYNCIHKELKQKGEVIDEWYRVTLTKGFNDEKDPGADVSINYEV